MIDVSEINVNSQYRLIDNKPLDAKLEPVEKVVDLYRIPRAQRYEGMTVTVLDYNGKGETADYQLIGGTGNFNWKRKYVLIDCGSF